MATKKKFKKMLRQLVNTMPVVMEHTHETHVVPGEELIQQGHTDDGKGGSIDPGKKYVQQMPVLLARNHENQLKRIYHRHGRKGITRYVNEIRTIAQNN